MSKSISQSEFNILVGKSICHNRNKIGFSQEYTANQIGLSRASIVNIEKGRQAPSLFLLWKFTDIFKVSFKELLPDLFSEHSISEKFKIEVKSKVHDGIITEESFKDIEKYLNK